MKTLLTAFLTMVLSLSCYAEEYWLAFPNQIYGTYKGYYIELFGPDQEVIVSNSNRNFYDTLYLNNNVVCTYRVPDLIAKTTLGTAISDHGIKIKTEYPTQVTMINYDYLRGGMTIVREFKQLGDEYMALSKIGNNPDIISILAIRDCKVTVSPSVNTNYATQPFTQILTKGKVITLTSHTQNKDGLSGTTVSFKHIHTDSPIPGAVFINSNFITNPQTSCCADDMDHQEIPYKEWGTSYFVPIIKNVFNYLLQPRISDVKIIAKTDGTIVKIQGQTHHLNKKEIIEYALQTEALITSNYPIRVNVFTRGGYYDNSNADPVSIEIPRLNQTTSHIGFKPISTPNIQDHYLIVVHNSCYDFYLDGDLQTNHNVYDLSICVHYYKIDKHKHEINGEVQAYYYCYGDYVEPFDAFGMWLGGWDSTYCSPPDGIEEIKNNTLKLNNKLYNLLGQEIPSPYFPFY